MPLISGSAPQSDALLAMVQPQYRDLSKFYKNQEMENLRSWISRQPHLPEFTDDHLLLFLHASNYSVERTKEVIDNYCTLRGLAPELFSDRSAKTDIHEALTVAYYSPLPGNLTTKEGNVLAFQKFQHTDSSKFNLADAIKGNLLMIDFMVACSPLCEGLELVMDMNNVTLGHVAKMRVPVLKKFITYVEEAIPIRLKRIHVLNTVPIIEYIMAVLTPLMKQELLNLIHFHKTSDFEEFTEKYVCKTLLPLDYGGQQLSLKDLHDSFVEQITRAETWATGLELYKSDESRRPGKSKSASEVYGMEGSFKKLDID